MLYNTGKIHSYFLVYRFYSHYLCFATDIQTGRLRQRHSCLGSLQTNMLCWGRTTITAVPEVCGDICDIGP